MRRLPVVERQGEVRALLRTAGKVRATKTGPNGAGPAQAGSAVRAGVTVGSRPTVGTWAAIRPGRTVRAGAAVRTGRAARPAREGSTGERVASRWER
jgi:hypothetical protein